MEEVKDDKRPKTIFEEPFSPSQTALVARALNDAKIPCVLWGDRLLRIHGVQGPANAGLNVDFIIPDKYLEKAKAAISSNNMLNMCQNPKCGYKQMKRREENTQPNRVFHAHLADHPCIEVNIHLESEWLSHLSEHWLSAIPDLLVTPASLASPEASEVLRSLYKTVTIPTQSEPTTKPELSKINAETIDIIVPRVETTIDATIRHGARNYKTTKGGTMYLYLPQLRTISDPIQLDKLVDPVMEFWEADRTATLQPKLKERLISQGIQQIESFSSVTMEFLRAELGMDFYRLQM